MAEALADGLPGWRRRGDVDRRRGPIDFPEEHFWSEISPPKRDLSGDSGSSSVKISDKLSGAQRHNWKLSGRCCRAAAAYEAERCYTSTKKCQTGWLGCIDLRLEYIFEACILIGPI
jgi:hypothetical protein